MRLSGIDRHLALGDLLDMVGMLDLLAAPKGLDVRVNGAVIHDIDEGLAAEPGDVVLGVGVDPARDGAKALLEQAGVSGVAALVVKQRGDGDLGPLVDAAQTAGVAVLAAPADVAWGHLHALCRTAIAAGAVGDAPIGGAPVGDLFGLANAVAVMVGGPVTIEDPRSNVLAYSNLADHEVDDGRRATILGRRVPDEWLRRQQDDGTFRRLFQEQGVIRFEYPGLRPRLATAVRAGDEVIGSIWVQQGDRPLDDEAEAAIAEAARIAALHLLRHRSRDDLERGRRAELLRAALDGRVAPAALGPVLGIAAATPLTVFALELVPTDDDDEAARSVKAERVANMAALYCESYRRPAAVVAIAATVFVLVPGAGITDRDRLVALATDMCRRATDALHANVRAGIGRTVGSLDDLLASRDEATRVLRALAATPDAPAVATARTVGSQLVLQYLREVAAGEPLLRAGKLDVLAESDSRRGTDYVPTLRAYFDALGDVPRAAASQGVHPNTFRYRLRRLAEVAGLDLDDPIDRLVAELQLRWS